MILETTKYRNNKLEELKEEISSFNSKPKLLVIIADRYNESSEKYVKNKHIIAEKVGIEIIERRITNWKDDTKEFLKQRLKFIIVANRNKVNGIICQLPFPNLSDNEIAELIPPELDVDGFHPENLGKLMRGQNCLQSCTPKGIVDFLSNIDDDFNGVNICIVGRSNIVGKPLANMFINKGATVTICNSKTKNLRDITKQSEIVICAIGKAKFFDKSYFNSSATVIDVGINFVDGKMCGDVDYDDVVDNVRFLTPVPKGVGILTTLALMQNTVKAYKDKKEIK